ncbi:MAG: type II secretion system F family protein [Defluviitaleaceae bacterium]|nr:type II secretion system F family protein [Defluviitaleaceae bacterium]MCL2262146.1 type II secretion system F family protein [Defluviitaleaceae bacterium]
MPNYSYVAVNISGNEIKGEHTAPDEGGVAVMLHQQGYYPTIIKKAGGMGSVQFGTPKLPIKVVARLCTQVAAMLRSGVPIVRTLEILASEAENKQLKTILDDVNSSIKQGSSFSEAVNPHIDAFPVLFQSMVDAGEASGTLDACLERAGASFTRTAKLNARVKGAMIYPSIILVVMIGMLIVMMTVVVPQFVTIFEDGGAELPAFTQMLMNVSDFMLANAFILIAIAVAVGIMVATFFKTEFGKYNLDKFKTRVPVISKLTNKVYAARFTRSLSSLVAAGVNMPEALEISARTVINTFLKQALLKVVTDVKQGSQLSEALIRMNEFPQLVSSVAKIGEESGELEGMLTQVADYYDDEADVAITSMLTAMEPALILIMAAVVVPILFGVLQPMFGMMDAVQGM